MIYLCQFNGIKYERFMHKMLCIMIFMPIKLIDSESIRGEIETNLVPVALSLNGFSYQKFECISRN